MQYANAISNLVSSVQKGITTFQQQQFQNPLLLDQERSVKGAELQQQDSQEKPVSLVSTFKNAITSTAMLRPNGGSDQSTSMASLSEPESIRLQRFKQELSGSCINLHALRRLAFHGVPDRDNLRAVVWKLLLSYLPPSPEDWPAALAKRRTQYHVFCDELMLDPKRLSSNTGRDLDVVPPLMVVGITGPLQAQDVTSDDHPLSLAQSSQWNVFFQDSEVMAQVERDVMRTHPDMHFFTGESPEAEVHREEMKRALFLYAKLNPGLRYIQGMNELIAPLYYIFKLDPDDRVRQYAEADAFWCFMELISEFRDHFCQQLDNAQTGIRATIRKLMAVLRHHDAALWKHIEVVHKVDAQFFAFRWITLLLSQEFTLPDTLRVWDMILSDPHGRTDALMRICTAMVLNVKDVLMQGDFTVIMKTLQRYPPVDVNVILSRAAAMTPCSEIL
ncbi:hypothetical protein CEUSTIGMA_g10399.t1 [Chlamydomonas eustigma]|uniref:Rab-GAP TBC domain-containing protein n=1 Tax=Chlamydomonas eustigma TaxID=1157962 RepID=A0A250XJ81_9CHLO|nr:hypothetical protein CEUSTIGMA_g10399.t1 [Chlamydomonas eustigma]|eukprot:GAX82972.1 hypothetical protein CEUSTIGMA_g10399.t1 [Chlamydomonas eustigma]